MDTPKLGRHAAVSYMDASDQRGACSWLQQLSVQVANNTSSHLRSHLPG